MDPTMIIVSALAAAGGAGAAYWLMSGRTRALVAQYDAETASQAALAVLEGQRHREELQSVQASTDLAAQREIARAREGVRAEEEAQAQRTGQEQKRLSRRAEELERHAVRAERRDEELVRREKTLGDKQRAAAARESELDVLREDAVLAIERASGLSREEAQKRLFSEVEERSKAAIARKVLALEESARERAEVTAKNIISMAIQRYAGEYTCERTVSVVNLPSEEIKGRIIGREGRNIRALEAATGVDFIIDDTPQCIVISAFNPIRREVARRTLETLLEDGRIHPSRVESVVRKTESEFHKIIRAAGQEAADEAGISGIHPEILKLLGALKYRTSYGQNQWQHAIEVAFLCGTMAAELGLDIKRAKRAGLLHDIGKVLDQTAEGSHALIGAEFARKHGEQKVIVNAIASHHEEVPQETIYACLAQAADAISGARPGARRQMMQSYNQRLTDLERISNSFPGVERSYAVQAGREVRVIVENGRVTDEEAVVMSHEIAQKIETEMAYPGQIKVTVIRETRIVNYAR